MTDTQSWVPQSCTLPTTEQPLRVAEFDEFFASHLVAVLPGESPGTLRLELAGGAEVLAAARDLAARESECCSFFAFDVRGESDRVLMTVTVPEQHADLLAGLGHRADAARAASPR